MVNQANGTFSHSHRVRPDVLMLAHRVPYPPDKGDRIRTYHLLRHLARRAAVHLVCLADEPVAPETQQALDRLCVQVEIVPNKSWPRYRRMLGSLLRGKTLSEGAFWSPAAADVLKNWTRRLGFHAAVVSASSMVPYLWMEELRHVPAVVDLVDVDSQKWFDYAADTKWPRSWVYELEGRRLRRLEKGLPTWARAVTLVSDAEASLYQSFCSPGPVHAIVNGVDLDYFRPQPANHEHGCVFVGALDYHPNVQGAIWFCNEIWPLIMARMPETRLSLVGRRPVAAVRKLGSIPGVQVVGQVPDVRPYVASAALAVVPLTIARGVQNKVLEAMAMAKAVAASPQALTGLSVLPGAQVLQCNTREEWVAGVCLLLKHQALRSQLGCAARRYVEENHSWDVCLEPFGDLMDLPKAEDTSAPGFSPHLSPSLARRLASRLPR